MNTTGGGTFDAADRHCYFIAGDRKVPAGGEPHQYALVAATQLQAKTAMDSFHNLLDSGAKVFLDSGVFALTADFVRRTGRPVADAFAMPPEELPGFHELLDHYVGLARKYEQHLWGYVELDLGGVEGKRRMRARLEAQGLRPIPVYHPLFDGWDYFDELAEGYDRLCWANMADGDRVRRKRMVATAWERHRRYPDLWLHLLGWTPNDWAAGMPADSADSSSWLSSVRWGTEHGSGYLRRVGTLPLNYRYATGNQVQKALALAAANAHFTQRTWRTVRQALDQDLGSAAYPPPHSQEVLR